MAELGVTYPACGMDLKAPHEHELAKVVGEHSKTAHDMELSEEKARERIKEMLAGRSGD